MQQLQNLYSESAKSYGKNSHQFIVW